MTTPAMLGMRVAGVPVAPEVQDVTEDGAVYSCVSVGAFTFKTLISPTAAQQAEIDARAASDEAQIEATTNLTKVTDQAALDIAETRRATRAARRAAYVASLKGP